jgi:hypothetical protein
MPKEFRSKGGVLEKYAEWNRNTLFCRGHYSKGRKRKSVKIYTALTAEEYHYIMKQRQIKE